MAGFTVRTSILPLLLAIPAYASAIQRHRSTETSTSCTTEETATPSANYYDEEESGDSYRVAGHYSSASRKKHHGYNTSSGSDLQRQQQYTSYYDDYEPSAEPTGGYPVSTDLPLNLYGSSDSGDDYEGGDCKCTVSVYPNPVYFPDVYTVHPDSTSQFAAEITAKEKRPVVVKYVTALPTSVITYGRNRDVSYATVTAGTPAVHYSVDMNYGDCPAPTKTNNKGYYLTPMETVVIGNDKTHGRKCLSDLIPENNCMTYTIMQEPPMRTKTVLCQLDAEVTGGSYVPGMYNGYDGYDKEHSYSTGAADEEGEVEPTGVYAQDFEESTKELKFVPAAQTPPPTPVPAPAPAPAPVPAPAAPAAPAPPAWSKSPEVYNSMTKALASMPTDAQKNVMFQNSAAGSKGIHMMVTMVVAVSAMLFGLM